LIHCSLRSVLITCAYLVVQIVNVKTFIICDFKSQWVIWLFSIWVISGFIKMAADRDRDEGMDLTVGGIIFFKFISKRRIISLVHSSILRQIWLNFMALFGFYWLFHTPPPGFPILYGLSTAEETSLMEVCVWCLGLGILLVLHSKILVMRNYYATAWYMNWGKKK
jgi:hypothetical protein